MNYIKKYFFFFSILIILNNCGGWKNFTKTMSGEKVTTTDEFLIKKKDPLALPPGYEELPLPNTKKKEKYQYSPVINWFKKCRNRFASS